MGETFTPTRTLKEAVAAILSDRSLDCLRSVTGASEAVIQVMYDGYGKDAVDAEMLRQTQERA